MRVKSRWLMPILGLSILSALLLTASVAHGGLRWSGMDPELLVNGDRINILIEWPGEHTCDIDGEIETEIGASKDAEVILISESMETFGCDGGSTKLEIKTVSDLTGKAKKNKIRVKARMRGEEKFPFRLMVYRNGEYLATCEGETDDKKYKADCGQLNLEDGWTSFNGEENVVLGSDFLFGAQVNIKKNVVIGDDVELGDKVHIGKDSVIGDDVIIEDGAKIDDNAHIGSGAFIGEKAQIKKKVIIGANVDIGENAKIEDEAVICDGESIADGAKIAKKTVVGSC